VSPNAGKTHKRPFEFIFDVFAESDNEAAVDCQKRSRCSDVVINEIRVLGLIRVLWAHSGAWAHLGA
jgi:hypothetical protein